MGGPTSWVAGSQGVIRVGQTVIARLIETQIWHPPARSVVRILRKETVASVSTSVWKKVVPQLLP